MKTMTRRYPLSALVVLALAGCAGEAAHRQGIDLYSQGKQEEGLARLEQAAREAPGNQIYAQAYRNARMRIVGDLLAGAQRHTAAGAFADAEASYRHALRIDPGNAEAIAGLAGLERERAHATVLAEVTALIDLNDYSGAQRRLEEVLRDNPRHVQARALRQTLQEKAGHDQGIAPALRSTFQRPVTLEFRDASLRQVLEALARHSGLNFILDRDVPPNLTVTVFLRGVTVADALDLILTTRQLRSRVLNDNSLLVYPDTAAKQGEHQDLLVRNFFLANADAKQVMTMLKTVLKVKNIFADDKLNLLVMRDTPAMIELAERLVATEDIGEPEVMLELAVLEVTRSRLTSIGVQFPSQLSLIPLPSANNTGLTFSDLKNLNSDSLGAAISPLIINMQDDANGQNLLANPRIRTHSREKAVIRIGDRVPVITTTATSTGFVSENVQYLDVGLKLEVEPVVFPDDEISIKLALEVSNVVAQVVSKAGTVAYRLGGRNAATVLRLRDGETQVLGGLINDDDRRTSNRFPGLNQLPLLGRLFSSEGDNNQKTELVLAVRPRILRGLVPPLQVPAKFWSGTESSPRLRPAAGPADAATAAAGTAPLLPGSVSSVAAPGAVPAPAFPAATPGATPPGPVREPALQPDDSAPPTPPAANTAASAVAAPVTAVPVAPPASSPYPAPMAPAAPAEPAAELGAPSPPVESQPVPATPPATFGPSTMPSAPLEMQP